MQWILLSVSDQTCQKDYTAGIRGGRRNCIYVFGACIHDCLRRIQPAHTVWQAQEERLISIILQDVLHVSKVCLAINY